MVESEEPETQSLEITLTNVKKEAVSTTENNKASKTRRWYEVDELIDMFEERVCL